jgi:uncharacterized protein YndB with AHSA1/START domain
MATTTTAAAQAAQTLVITRVFDAPRALVWKVWTDPVHLARWWGPKDFTNPVCEVDLQPGGTLNIVMRGPDGVDYPMTGVFREIVEPERLVFSARVDDDAADVHLEVLTTVTLAEQGAMTRLTMRAEVVRATPAAAPMLAGMDEGWNQSLDRLDAYLAEVSRKPN